MIKNIVLHTFELRKTYELSNRSWAFRHIYIRTGVARKERAVIPTKWEVWLSHSKIFSPCFLMTSTRSGSMWKIGKSCETCPKVPYQVLQYTALSAYNCHDIWESNLHDIVFVKLSFKENYIMYIVSARSSPYRPEPPGEGRYGLRGQIQGQIQKHPYDNHFIINVHVLWHLLAAMKYLN